MDETADGASRAARGAYLRNTIVVIVGIIATTLPQVNVLMRIPLLNLLKNELHVDRTMASSFIFITGLAWYAKPIFGIINDAYPLFGTRRKSYMTIGATISTSCLIATIIVPHQYGILLTILVLANVGMVLSSCAMGGLLVETAQEWGASGRLSAVRQGMEAVSFVLSGLVSGYLATLVFGITAGVCAGLAFTLIPVAIGILREPYHAPQPLGAVKGQLRTIFRAKPMWGAAALMLLFYIAPGTTTVLFYRQQNVLHMSTEIQGLLVSTAYGASIVTAFVYSFLCRHFNLRHLLLLGIGAAALTAIFYLFYNSIAVAFLIDGLNGVGYTLAELAFLDLCARSAPVGSESLGYSLMLSVRNLALFGTDIIGSHLMDSYGVSYYALVTINSITTAIALPFVFLLPMALVGRKDVPKLATEASSFDETAPRSPLSTHT